MGRSCTDKQKQEWNELIQNQRRSASTVANWCRKNNVTVPQFYYWQRRLKENPVLTRESFAELVDNKDPGITLEFRDVRIHLTRQFDPMTLKNCLQALQGIKC